MKTCTKCGIEKSFDEFSADNRGKTPRYQPKCKTCNKAYYESKRERVKARVKQRYWDNHEVVLARQRELKSTPEAKVKKALSDKKYSAKNKEKIAEYRSRYWREHKAERLAYYHSWRAKQLGVKDTLTAAEISHLIDTQESCFYCQSSKKLTIEHIKTMTKGGDNTLENVTLVCHSCNESKKNKEVEVWLAAKNYIISPRQITQTT